MAGERREGGREGGREGEGVYLMNISKGKKFLHLASNSFFVLGIWHSPPHQISYSKYLPIIG